MAENVWSYDLVCDGGFGARGTVVYALMGRSLYRVLLDYRTTGMVEDYLTVFDPGLTHGSTPLFLQTDLVVVHDRVQVSQLGPDGTPNVPADWTTLTGAEVVRYPETIPVQIVEAGGGASSPTPRVQLWADAFASTPDIVW